MAVSARTAIELIDELYLMGRAFRGAVADESPILPGGLGVLMALEARGQCRQNELASDLCISQSALSRHVTELVAEGYVAMRVRSFAKGTAGGDLTLVLWAWGDTPLARLELVDDEGRLE